MAKQMSEAIKRIAEHGDLLERRFYSDREFCSAFDLYPVAWCLVIPQNRAAGTIALADGKWSKFAARHYSTIVRCWSAREAFKEITSTAESAIDDPTADHFIAVHRQLFAFFCSLGAAIDNMRHTFQSPPINNVDAFEAIYSRDTIDYSLEYLYERRTQFIHKAVTPCFSANGLISIDAALFDDTETDWNHPRPIKVTEITTIVEVYWGYFTDEMRAAWSKLIERLKRIAAGSVSEISFPEPTPQQLIWSSGSSNQPQGNPHFIGIKPSGAR